MWTRLVVVAVLLMVSSNAFMPLVVRKKSAFFVLQSDSGGVEQIEFKIYPDGRVEETVRGIKGNNCHSVTEKINEALGDVIASAPTEEMYEQVMITDQTITQTQGDGSNNSWGGGSTW